MKYKDKEVVKVNFDNDFNFNSNEYYLCYLNDELLIFLEYEKYNGPITMQYLPSGGIQSLIHGNLIIKVNNGFLSVKKLVYRDKEYLAKDFIHTKKDCELVNQIMC